MGERGDRGIDKERDGDATGRDGEAEEGEREKKRTNAVESVERMCFPLGRPSSLFCFITSALCGGFARPAAGSNPPHPPTPSPTPSPLPDDQVWGALLFTAKRRNISASSLLHFPARIRRSGSRRQQEERSHSCLSAPPPPPPHPGLPLSFPPSFSLPLSAFSRLW